MNYRSLNKQLRRCGFYMKRQHLQADCLEIFYTVGERAAKSARKAITGHIYYAILMIIAKLPQGQVNQCI